MAKKLEVKSEEPQVAHGESGARPPITEKESLLLLYKQLQDLGVRSISDLENLIARAE